MSKLARTLAASALAAALTLGLAAVVSAQYEPPTGNVSLDTDDTAPALGGQVTISATVHDPDGAVLSGVECSFRVAEQPGTGASVGAATVTTDANGRATTTLNTGDASGAIVVEAVCGDLTAQVTVAAGGAAPPASLPDTGSGPTSDGGNAWALWALIASGAAAVLGATALAWRRARA